VVTPPPRLHVLTAAAAPVAVVFRRGPSSWANLVRLDLDAGTAEHGAWLRGRLFPRRSALSADGNLLGYVAHTGRKPPWDAYVAISRPPWLTALAAWHAPSLYVEGCAFGGNGSFAHDAEEPLIAGRFPRSVVALETIAPAGVSARWVLRDLQTELRGGFRPVDDATAAAVLAAAPVPAARDLVTIGRERPRDPSRLLAVLHAGHQDGASSAESAEVHYVLVERGDAHLLEDVTCAAWDPRGRLVTTHADGMVRVRDWRGARQHTRLEVDLAPLRPTPTPAPAWAQRPL
jgi:hypothetical protein